MGRARVAALRQPDFYGLNVGLAYLGDTTIGALARGKPALFFGSPDIPHDYAYVPDIARAVTTLLDAPNSAFGQAWHLPCAPTRTTREILQIAADTLGAPLRIRSLPAPLLGPIGLFSPMMREMREMRFQWDQPYRVNGETAPRPSGPTQHPSRRASARRRFHSAGNTRQCPIRASEQRLQSPDDADGGHQCADPDNEFHPPSPATI